MVSQRNTSACAEKRPTNRLLTVWAWKYLRVCGKERHCALLRNVLHGNTSACAEKSWGMSPLVYPIWKYLRVCGEERIHCQHDLGGMEIPPRVRRRAICRAAPGDLPEIPPRVRRRVANVVVHVNAAGNTSACAEKRLPILRLYYPDS